MRMPSTSDTTKYGTASARISCDRVVMNVRPIRSAASHARRLVIDARSQQHAEEDAPDDRGADEAHGRTEVGVREREAALRTPPRDRRADRRQPDDVDDDDEERGGANRGD